MRFASRSALVALLATRVFGHPAASPQSHNGGLVGRAIDLSAFRLQTIAKYSDSIKTSEDGVELPPSFAEADYISTATALVEATFPGLEFRLADDHYVSKNGIGHVFFKQTVYGLDIDNADFNANIAKDGSVFSFGNSFFTGKLPAESPLKKRDQVDPVEALKGAQVALSLPIVVKDATAQPEETTEHYVIDGVSGTLSPPKARLVYFQNTDNTLSLTWRVETDISDNWLLSYVDAKRPEKVFGVVDYVSDASYTVYPWGTNDPSIPGAVRVVETNPHYSSASEFTWQGTGTTTYTTTRGNNGIAQANYEGDNAYLNDYRPTAAGANFNYPYSPATSSPKSYIDASITQLFYTANMYHDLLHVLGFNEAAGNFETNNNGQGGVGNDAVILNAQDGSGTNNANFATPVDGQAPRMRMYLWTTSIPTRDCSFDASVIIHEYTHGVSNRLTGGPANSACLTATEAGGMGEGWGDFMAISINLKTSDTRSTNYPLGAWVSGKPGGIRNYLYSTSLTTNPMTYATVNGQTAVHFIGTVWASILYEVLWNLVDAHGITSARRPTFTSAGVPTDGRFLAMQLVVDGLALQPCNPTFISARNAIIDADIALTGGANRCLLWTAFAKRGLGSVAARGTGNSGRTQSFVVPAGVC